jgi:hypothetical protein
VTRRFVVPPDWPQPPSGWEPPPDWQPSPAWGPAPTGWQFWVDDQPAAPVAAQPVAPTADSIGSREGAGRGVPEPDEKIPVFGARSRAKELAAEVAQLRAEMTRLGTLEIAELERRRDGLRHEVAEQEARLASQLRQQTQHLQKQADDIQEKQRRQVISLRQDVERHEQRLRELKADVVVTNEAVILQEVGIYEARHPLSDAATYQAELTRIQDQIRAAAKKVGGAVQAAQDWMVNGSAAKGRTMLNDYSKLMLRAYNAEAENLVRAMKPYKLQTSVDRLDRVARTIERLGKTMSIRIAPSYHQLRIEELELTADYLDKVATEKERDRQERERLREERKVQQEIESERRRLEKERQHYLNALDALIAKGDLDAAARLREQIAEIERAIEDVDYRAANIRAGYVYVISNMGAFGDDMIKIGMTRRLDPMDRVRELGDASVPFRFDVHALFFSDDAVGIESAMHTRLADRRVNRVNLRREFFYATPAEAKDLLLELTGSLLEFQELPEAMEFRQSKATAPRSSVLPAEATAT